MEATPATYEQLPHILEAGVKQVITGTVDTGAGSGSGRVYTYTFPTTAQPTLTTYSIDGGDNQQAETMAYGYVESFKLAGKYKEALTMAAEWKARTVATTTFASTATLPTVEEIIFGNGVLYIDTIGGTWGGTTKSSTLLGFDFDYKTGVRGVFSADGQLYFTFTKTGKPEVRLKVTFEHDATSVAEIVKWKAETPGLVRLRFDGATLSTAGTTYTKKTVIIDVAGKWLKFDPIGDDDGDDIRVGTFAAIYDETATNFGRIIVVNEVSVLP